MSESELRTALEDAGWEITRFERDVIAPAGVDDLAELPVWVLEATASPCDLLRPRRVSDPR